MANRYDLEMLDGTRHTVQALVADTLDAETQFRRHKSWGPVNESPIKLTTLVAYSAAKREGIIPEELPFDRFVEQVALIKPAEDAATETDEEGPLDEGNGLGKGTQ